MTEEPEQGKAVEIDKNARETIRVQAKDFKGKPYVDARIWAWGREGQMVATPKGLTLAPEVAVKVAQAMLECARKADRAEGQEGEM